jgi:hypothetical protein
MLFTAYETYGQSVPERCFERCRICAVPRGSADNQLDSLTKLGSLAVPNWEGMTTMGYPPWMVPRA